MKLNLNRPIAFFDLETTGINIATDRIVEISILRIAPDGSETIKTERVNPTIPIPLKATEIHGISNEDVKDAPTFAELAKDLLAFLGDSDLAGFNSNRFDIPLLVEEFLRAGIDFDTASRRFIDVQAIYHKMEQRTLSAAYRYYCQKELENAHSAEADIKATYEVLSAQLKMYEELKNDMDFLHDFSCMNNNVDFAGRMVYDEKKREVFNFGKHKGKLVEKVLREEPSYYSWIMQGQFPLNTKQVLTRIKERMGQRNAGKNTLFDHFTG